MQVTQLAFPGMLWMPSTGIPALLFSTQTIGPREIHAGAGIIPNLVTAMSSMGAFQIISASERLTF
jgi:hypothetical protein